MKLLYYDHSYQRIADCKFFQELLLHGFPAAFYVRSIVNFDCRLARATARLAGSCVVRVQQKAIDL